MECPVCRESMVVIEFDNIELDYCVGCMGVWFDTGEIELLLEKAGIRVPGKALHLAPVESVVRELKRPCPLCRKTMRKVSPPGSDVILDECPNGEGIWFDAGEIRQAIVDTAGASGEGIAQILRKFLGEALSE